MNFLWCSCWCLYNIFITSVAAAPSAGFQLVNISAQTQKDQWTQQLEALGISATQHFHFHQFKVNTMSITNTALVKIFSFKFS